MEAFFACKKSENLVTFDCIPAALQSGVIAFYPFNSGALTDESLNANDLTNPTTAVSATDRNGNTDCAYQFDNSAGDNEFLTFANPTFLDNLNSFSISLWYMPMDSTRDGGNLEVLFGRDDDQIRCPDRRGQWSLGLYDCRRAVFGHDNSVWAELQSNPFTTCEDEVYLLTAQWHHFAAVKDGNDYFIYFNGNLEETESGAAGCNNQYLAQDIGDLFLGKRYTGLIDDVLVYNRALGGQEVAELYSLASCCN